MQVVTYMSEEGGYRAWGKILWESIYSETVCITNMFGETVVMPKADVVYTKVTRVLRDLKEVDYNQYRSMAACVAIPEVGTKGYRIDDTSRFYDLTDCPVGMIAVMFLKTDLGYEPDGDPFREYITLFMPAECFPVE